MQIIHTLGGRLLEVHSDSIEEDVASQLSLPLDCIQIKEVCGKLRLLVRLCGAKGEFGSNLRRAGKRQQRNKANVDACRDLSGRRIGDVRRERELREARERKEGEVKADPTAEDGHVQKEAAAEKKRAREAELEDKLSKARNTIANQVQAVTHVE